MSFRVVDMDKWDRKEYFEQYFTTVPCTYSMCCNLDVTKIKNKQINFYAAMLYFITYTVNKFEQFRTAINDKGQVGIYDEMSPCYTIFHKDTNTFSNLWTQYTDKLSDFVSNYMQDAQQYSNVHKFDPKPNKPCNCFTISALPWTTFSAFNLNLQKGYDYLLPIFTIGKYYTDNGRTMLPIAIQVHHAVCDGYHICSFVNSLQQSIDNFIL